MISVYKAMSPDDRQRVYDWVSSHGTAALFDLKKPNMRREGENGRLRRLKLFGRISSSYHNNP